MEKYKAFLFFFIRFKADSLFSAVFFSCLLAVL